MHRTSPTLTESPTSTKTGDEGKTSLFDNSRVWKSHDRIMSYGAVDELNSSLGIALSLELDNFSDELEILAKFTDPEEALVYIEKTPCDCIFLDIEMEYGVIISSLTAPVILCFFIDHTLGINVALASIPLGACLIEKHVTLSREEKSPDSEFSLEE